MVRWRGIALAACFAGALLVVIPGPATAVGAGAGSHLSGRLLAFRAAEALEAQLHCRASPQPARLFRVLLAQGLLRETPLGHDGSPVWAPTLPMKVFGVPVRYLTGWQADAGGAPLKPFTRGPGTMPPQFLAVTVSARPDPGVFPPSRARGPDGPLAAVDDTGADLKPGVALVCYGG